MVARQRVGLFALLLHILVMFLVSLPVGTHFFSSFSTNPLFGTSCIYCFQGVCMLHL